MIVAVAVYAIGILMIAVGVAFIRQSWSNRGGALNTDVPSPRWHGNLAGWRGHVRWTACCGPLALILATLAILVAASGASGVAYSVVMSVLLFAAVALALVISPAISLLNRPKWLVPPHLRHQPGRIAEALGEPVRPTPPPAPRGGREAAPIEER